MAKQLWALDFDGVICDSCGESSLSAWKAATHLWPEIFTNEATISKKDEVIEKMRLVRPVVETGVLQTHARCQIAETMAERTQNKTRTIK